MNEELQRLEDKIAALQIETLASALALHGVVAVLGRAERDRLLAYFELVASEATDKLCDSAHRDATRKVLDLLESIITIGDPPVRS